MNVSALNARGCDTFTLFSTDQVTKTTAKYNKDEMLEEIIAKCNGRQQRVVESLEKK